MEDINIKIKNWQIWPDEIYAFSKKAGHLSMRLNNWTKADVARYKKLLEENEDINNPFYREDILYIKEVSEYDFPWAVFYNIHLTNEKSDFVGYIAAAKKDNCSIEIFRGIDKNFRNVGIGRAARYFIEDMLFQKSCAIQNVMSVVETGNYLSCWSNKGDYRNESLSAPDFIKYNLTREAWNRRRRLEKIF